MHSLNEEDYDNLVYFIFNSELFGNGWLSVIRSRSLQGNNPSLTKPFLQRFRVRHGLSCVNGPFWLVRAGCYSWAALYLPHSKPLYISTDVAPSQASIFECTFLLSHPPQWRSESSTARAISMTTSVSDGLRHATQKARDDKENGESCEGRRNAWRGGAIPWLNRRTVQRIFYTTL